MEYSIDIPVDMLESITDYDWCHYVHYTPTLNIIMFESTVYHFKCFLSNCAKATILFIIE